MRLWTIQSVEVYDLIQKNGLYQCRESLSFARDIEARPGFNEWNPMEEAMLSCNMFDYED